MKSCRREALYNDHKCNDKADIKSLAKAYIISGMALFILISIILIKENNNLFALIDLKILGIIELTILFAAIMLIIYGLVLKIRYETFSNSIEVYEENNLLKKMSEINTFTSDIEDHNVSYYDVAKNSNGLDLLLLPLVIACAYYSQNSTVFNVILVIVVISIIIFIMTHCFPDKLNNYFKNDIRSKKGFKSYFLFAHITLFTTLIIVLLTFI